MVCIIAAMSLNRVIGRNNKLPWSLPDELKYFYSTTKGSCLIMGRKTFESIGSVPLPHRHTIVVTANKNLYENGFQVVTSLEEGIKKAKNALNSNKIFISGGAKLYEEGIKLVGRIYLTTINTIIYDGDTFFPEIDIKLWKKISSQHHPSDKKHAHSFDIEIFDRKI